MCITSKYSREINIVIQAFRMVFVQCLSRSGCLAQLGLRQLDLLDPKNGLRLGPTVFKRWLGGDLRVGMDAEDLHPWRGVHYLLDLAMQSRSAVAKQKHSCMPRVVLIVAALCSLRPILRSCRLDPKPTFKERTNFERC